MDSTSYISGQITAYFQNDDNAEKAQKELLNVGVPNSAVVLQTLETADEDFLDALNRLFGSQSDQYHEGSILTVDDPTHGPQVLAIVQHYGGEIQVRPSRGEVEVDSPATGTQSSGNP